MKRLVQFTVACLLTLLTAGIKVVLVNVPAWVQAESITPEPPSCVLLLVDTALLTNPQAMAAKNSANRLVTETVSALTRTLGLSARIVNLKNEKADIPVVCNSKEGDAPDFTSGVAYPFSSQNLTAAAKTGMSVIAFTNGNLPSTQIAGVIQRLKESPKVLTVIISGANVYKQSLLSGPTDQDSLPNVQVNLDGLLTDGDFTKNADAILAKAIELKVILSSPNSQAPSPVSGPSTPTVPVAPSASPSAATTPTPTGVPPTAIGAVQIPSSSSTVSPTPTPQPTGQTAASNPGLLSQLQDSWPIVAGGLGGAMVLAGAMAFALLGLRKPRTPYLRFGGRRIVLRGDAIRLPMREFGPTRLQGDYAQLVRNQSDRWVIQLAAGNQMTVENAPSRKNRLQDGAHVMLGGHAEIRFTFVDPRRPAGVGASGASEARR